MLSSVYRERARKAFEYADKEVRGSLTKHGYKIAMTAVFGYCPDKTEVQCVFKSHANDISYEEFERWVTKKYHGNSERVSAKTLFALLDNNYKGHLVLDDLCSASKRADLKISPAIWEKVFQEWDQYKRGYVDLEQFLFISDSLQNGSK